MYKKFTLLLIFAFLAAAVAIIPAAAQEMSPECKARISSEKERHETRLRDIFRYEKQNPLSKQNAEDELYRANIRSIEAECANKSNPAGSSCKQAIDEENARHEAAIRYIVRNEKQNPLAAQNEEDNRHQARLQQIRQNCSK